MSDAFPDTDPVDKIDSRFDDGKDAGALRTIGEVVKALKIKPHVLRYWEEQFDALQPLKRSGGRRYYRAEDIALVERIDRLVNREGYTLKGAAGALEAGGGAAVGDKRKVSTPAATIDTRPKDTADIVRRLKTIRNDLQAALAV